LSEQSPLKSKIIRLWRLVLGLLLVEMPVKAWFLPNRSIPTYLQYSNDTQRIAGIAAQSFIFLLGVGLIVTWFRVGQLKPEQGPDKTSNSPHTNQI
jgi:hypothetical protein